ncbi:MAG: hypothetical protein WAT33_15370 [Giesbergeria sp.]
MALQSGKDCPFNAASAMSGEPTLSWYAPPITLWFMRRNQISLKVQPESKHDATHRLP